MSPTLNKLLESDLDLRRRYELISSLTDNFNREGDADLKRFPDKPMQLSRGQDLVVSVRVLAMHTA